MPFAVTGGWTNSQLKEFGAKITSNVWSIGGKFYFGAGKSLRDHQRESRDLGRDLAANRSFFVF